MPALVLLDIMEAAVHMGAGYQAVELIDTVMMIQPTRGGSIRNEEGSDPGNDDEWVPEDGSGGNVRERLCAARFCLAAQVVPLRACMMACAFRGLNLRCANAGHPTDGLSPLPSIAGPLCALST